MSKKSRFTTLPFIILSYLVKITDNYTIETPYYIFSTKNAQSCSEDVKTDFAIG